MELLYEEFLKQFRKGSYNHIIASILVENKDKYLRSDEIEKLFIKELTGRTRYPDTRKYVSDFIKTNRTKFVIEFDDDEDLMYLLDDDKLCAKKISREFNTEVKKYKNNIDCCEACGISEKDNKMELDHWRPYSKHNLELCSRVSSINNCVKLCIACNQVKKDNPSYILVQKGRMDYNSWLLLEQKMTTKGNTMTESEYYYMLYCKTL